MDFYSEDYASQILCYGKLLKLSLVYTESMDRVVIGRSFEDKKMHSSFQE